MSDTLALDAYQLTTLVGHADEGRLEHSLAMAFFFRRMPRERNYVVFCGLRQLLEHAAAMRFDAADLAFLRDHPQLGPALATRPALVRALEAVDGFDGELDGLPEGTLAYAGPASRTGGEHFTVAGARVTIYTPLVQARTDLLRAKLIETPWLSRINHASMVASKAARVATAAAGRPVFEFGQRRTHPHAAIDASYAAYIGGCAGTSNLLAMQRWGVPASGTMDHFAVQAAERPGVPVVVTERETFAALARAFPGATFLVDTYDTMRGVRVAVEASGGKLAGVRLDSSVTPELVTSVRALLIELGAPDAKILVSDGLDEHRVAALRAAGADAFGVGENIACVPDAATGVGAVAKVIVNGYGKITMKLAKGSGKATLPGHLQVYRFADHDVVATAEEAPPGGTPLLVPLWRGRKAVAQVAGETITATRARTAAGIAALPEHLRALKTDHGKPWPLVVSDALAARITHCVAEAERVS